MVEHVPLEANPETFNPLAASLGLDTTKYSIHDIFGFDEELLAFVPQPVEALILLFPEPAAERFDHPRSVAKNTEDMKKWPVSAREKLVYFRQTENLDNHCGTLALLHALANTPSLPIANGSMKQLFDKCRGLDPDESTKLLESTEITSLHENASKTVCLKVPDPKIDSGNHFLAFVNHEGQLIELDGWARLQPISHGPIQGDLLHSAINVVKKMMVEANSIKFSLMAIAPTQD
ncbi:hypothetical protein M422DRAFT_240901 [Sphaerobolus stellatus SS14]|nr:hypothetical protein M422DRAFT_240901 [Sphaerobolus stellatus SS14]